MKEVWIKKTIQRRYLVEDSELEEVEAIIKYDPERAEELIGDYYDKNEEIEYDNENIILPIDYEIGEVTD